LIDLVAGIDALGFVLGGALAFHLGKGFLAVRKAGKLPGPARRASFVDYTGQEKGLELRPGLVRAGVRVLVVDEWIETGAQVRAAIQLLTAQGAVIAGIAAIWADRNERTRPLFDAYNVQALGSD
jgi:adenine phosphoribosyltransferase